LKEIFKKVIKEEKDVPKHNRQGPMVRTMSMKHRKCIIFLALFFVYFQQNSYQLANIKVFNSKMLNGQSWSGTTSQPQTFVGTLF
jgi:hypothetical protein